VEEPRARGSHLNEGKEQKMPESPVLLVEDDPTDFRFVQKAFEKFKNEIRLFRLTNGDEAVDYLTGEGPFENRGAHPFPALMLLDLKLPRRSGFEVLQWLRSQPASIHRLPVVVLSGSDDPIDVNRAYDYGANSYLCKPAGYHQLEQLANEFEKYWMNLNELPEVQG
jgi:CheY-like chemotaxis protein